MHFLYSLFAILGEMSPYILLGFFIAGLLHVFIKPTMMGRHLAGNGFLPVCKAALFGIPLPLCSCGVLPTAVSLKRGGASNAAATSFLIATPQTGVDSIAATWSLLGPVMAVTRPLAALVCAIFGGVAVGKLAPSEIEIEKTTEHQENMQQHDHDHGCNNHGCDCHSADCSQNQPHLSSLQKIVAAAKYGFVDMIQHVGKWLVIGLVIAALITVFVPDDIFVGLADYPLLAMLVVVLVAVPMYICATGSIPIALSLMLKGLTPGVAFVMLMAGPAANFASVMVLRRSIGDRATALYVASVVIVAITFGLAIDYLLPAQWFMPTPHVGAMAHGGFMLGWFDVFCSLMLLALLANAWYLSQKSHKQINKETTEMKTQVFKVDGMMCAHCQANVRKGLETLAGVMAVNVDLEKSLAEVAGEVDAEAVIAKIQSLGYEASLAEK